MIEEDRATTDELVIAVYLDTNVLLDLLATVEDGFRLVERVTTGQTSGKISERSGGAEFTAPSFFSFFKVGFSGKLGRTTGEGLSETKEAELPHTYGSLLHRLRRYLLNEGLITSVIAEAGRDATVGSFVEFTGVVRPNPFTNSFQTLRRMLKFVDVVMATGDKPLPTPNKGNRGGTQSRRTPNQQASQLKVISAFLEQLTEDVEREGTSTVLFESQMQGYKAVVTLFDDFLRDRSMAELLNREFRVLGKIARYLPVGSPGGVDLLASSGIAGFPPEILAHLSGMTAEMSNAGMTQLGPVFTTIDPPVIEILPIAIYL